MSSRKSSHNSIHTILVLQGPNLQALGKREVSLYGMESLPDIQEQLDRKALELGFILEHAQSNHEGVLIDLLYQAKERQLSGILLNAGAYTHTSIALRDAITAIEIPTIEIHLSNLYQRESFRKESIIAPVCVGVIMGFRSKSYLLGLLALSEMLSKK